MSNQIARNDNSNYIEPVSNAIRRTKWLLQNDENVGSGVAAGQPVLYDTVDGNDELSDRIFHAIGGSVFDVLKSGTYFINGDVTFQNPGGSAVGSRGVWVLINNDGVRRYEQNITAIANKTNSMNFSAILNLNDTDEFEIRAFHSQGVNQNILGRGTDANSYSQLNITFLG